VRKTVLTLNTRRRLTLVDLDVTIISGETSLALTSVTINLIDACSYKVKGNGMSVVRQYQLVHILNPQTYKLTRILTVLPARR